MIYVRAFELGYYPIRGFLAWAEGDRTAIFVDPGGWDDAIATLLETLGLTLGAILLTHGHEDHTGGVDAMVANLGAPVYAHAGDMALLARRPDTVLAGDECVPCGSLAWRVLPVAGHTDGSVAYAAGDVVFTGDTLFAGAIGGTANLAAYEQERFAIRTQLFPLGDATRVYPAHGPATTIGIERRANPFLR
ncbi:MAG TPA: MBL fold metallo-hydrolase [Armatimonadota bacterium]|jgi:glyoxylase-like metal-dependent hydrolase (beta-lactamase superfamily II)